MWNDVRSSTTDYKIGKEQVSWYKLGIRHAQVLTTPRSPWQNAFPERMIGSIRRDYPDHVIVLSKRHLTRLLTRYLDCYHRWPTHLSPGMDSPDSPSVQLPALAKVVHRCL